MNTVKRAIFFASVFLLSACQSIVNVSQQDDSEELLVPILDYEANRGFIYFSTLSHGCTFIDSFKVKLADAKQNSIEIIQVKQDLCRMKQREITMQYSYKHLGLDLHKPVLLLNPVIESHSNLSVMLETEGGH